ncbi:MAG TPA: ATP-binding protein [Anaerolineales bacterium]|nr:ATP-binding protein [Anaerolineales bacterium]
MRASPVSQWPSPVRAGLARTSLTSRLVVTFVGVVLVTIVAGAVPAYVLFRGELERQMWNQVEAGGHVVGASLVEDRARLQELVGTLAERPTLRALLAQGRPSAVADYIDTFRRGVGLDFVLIRDASGSLVTTQPPGSPVPASGFSVSNGALVLAASQVLESDSSRFTVSGGLVIDDAFAVHRAETTGLELSFLVGGNRVATSLDAEQLPARSDPAGEGGKRIEIAGRQSLLLGTWVPLQNDAGDTVAVFEVGLPTDDLAGAERRWLASLAVGALLLLLGGTGLALGISHRLTYPLRQLTTSALKMSAGDLETPVPVPVDPPEIGALARSLEQSRAHLQESLGRLKRQKDWSDTLLRSIVEGIVTVDAEGKVTSFSPAAERITGWRADEIVGGRIDGLVRTADGDPFSEEVPHPGGKRTVRVLHRSGRPLTLAATAASVGSPDGGSAQLALVLRDITEEESVQSLRSYFLANISHEFRTPLSAINASVELLLENLGNLDSSELAELLDSIYRSVTGLQTLIDNLLESLSIEAGRFTVRRRPTDLPAVIEEAARVMRPLLNRRGQELRIEVPEGMAPLWIDPMRITQVLVNLLSNASKYSPVQVPILLQVYAPEGQRVRVQVADRGEGIPRAERENLFRRFVRLSVSESPQYGIGLGLSVVKAIVEEHGGEVGVEERPGGGSIFWFSLPLERGRG